MKGSEDERDPGGVDIAAYHPRLMIRRNSLGN